MHNMLERARKCLFLASTATLLAALAGCGATGGGVSVGNYTGAGSLNMDLSGKVVDQNGNPLSGFSVSIDNSTPVATDDTGSYALTIPTVDIVPENSIRVFNTANDLAHVEDRAINTAICIQTLQPIVVGPPGPPNLP